MSDFNKAIPKTDSAAILSGKPIYTDDLAPDNCLIVKLLRSPHAFAEVIAVDKERALKVPGIIGIYSHEDTPETRFNIAGQTFPRPSPNDRRILDRWARFVGDPVAIVAGVDEVAVDKALQLLKVEYRVLEHVLEPEDALDNPILIHPEEDWNADVDMGYDVKRNLVAHGDKTFGDLKGVFNSCDHVIEREYKTIANHQQMMETFRAATWLDEKGHLTCLSSTQIPFHIRRTLASALGLPLHQVRVIKPRIGGGFGAKQTGVCEMYPAFVTHMTGRPAKIIFSRTETTIAGSPRHPMHIRVKLGAMRDGTIRAIEIYTLSNTGAYGEHGPTTVGLSGDKTIPLYGKQEAYRFSFDVVYTNRCPNGAYRGYGATQGTFALESCVDELAHELGIDPLTLRQINAVEQGQWLHTLNEPNSSCVLDQLLASAREKIGWDEIYPCRTLPNGHIEAVGCAMTLQGSGISNVDTASARIMLEDGGNFRLLIGSTDMGTGSDTSLAQIASEVLQTTCDRIAVQGVDTDVSPYDPGSYASSTAYTTGNAVKLSAEKLLQRMKEEVAEHFSKGSCEQAFDGELTVDSNRSCTIGQEHGLSAEDISYDGEKFTTPAGDSLTLQELATRSLCGDRERLIVEASWGGEYSPPPFMVGCAKIDLDPATGIVEVVDYVGEVDCGTIINPNLVRVQAEGGVLQGIGMALYEDTSFSKSGKMLQNSFLQYKIPTRRACPNIRIDFISSYEPTGPFGVKSIGEVVINTPSPAIANALHNAGVRVRDLPLSSEKIWQKLQEQK